MSCFTKKLVDNPKFPELSAEVKRLKSTEGGASAVCEVMQKYNVRRHQPGILTALSSGNDGETENRPLSPPVSSRLKETASMCDGKESLWTI